MSSSARRLSLSDLPFVARLTLAVFLCSVGLGYLAALVQLHVQQAKPGQLLPSDQDVIDTYHGRKGVSVIERLVTADEHQPFTSSGSMRPAFTTKSLGWKQKLKERANEIAKRMPAVTEPPGKLAEVELRDERNGEAAVLVAWVRGGADKKSYDDNEFVLPDALKSIPDNAYVTTKSKDDKPERVAIRTLINDRCCKCHKETTTDPASAAPLDTYERIVSYTDTNEGDTGMPLRKLAQSTHVHLLGFSVLYGLTGLIFACSGWPGIVRFLIAPLPLLAQVVDISFWWLARMPDPCGSEFARCIRFSGMVVGGSLALQIVLGLFSLFGWFGRFVLVLLLAAAAVGAYYLNDHVIVPYLADQAKLAVSQ